MTPERFRDVALELATENPLAVRSLLRILAIDFTTEVPTMEVTCDARPTLRVNLEFVGKHCASDSHVKAVILHEFLHILLRHTDRAPSGALSEALALDAVINAIIDRQMGDACSSMMAKYYAEARGVWRLLRKPRGGELEVADPEFASVWRGLYEGALVADDIREIAERIAGADGEASCRLLGGHDPQRELPEALVEALQDSLRTMTGGGIWRAPFRRGIGAEPATAKVAAAEIALRRWRRATLDVLRRYVVPDAQGPAGETRPRSFVLPVLSPGDRRAFLRTTWSPFLPEATWWTEVKERGGLTQVYLDVSGSMDAELPHVIALLESLRRHIRMPFWAFSTKVEPARIVRRSLITATTGGTSLECVLQHVEETEPESAVIVTDGYIEPVASGRVAAIGATRFGAIVTRDGSTHLLDRAGIACTQLERVPA